jgi:rusticyanin
MSPKRLAIVIGAVALVAGGIGAGVAAAASHTSSAQTTPAASTGEASYSWYRSMMENLQGGSMMGGSYGWMMGETGYRWMMGGTSVPNWMRGEALPGFMMGTSTDPGEVMGALFANAPGPRVSPSKATQLGNEMPAGTTVDTARHRITFSGASAQLVVVASPSGGPDETFRIAGMVNPTIEVNADTRVRIEVVNADADAAHGLVVTATGTRSSWMPMMTARPAFTGSALWFLGEPTSAGMHASTFSFTATTPGTYEYLCPVPGHAQKGMLGTFVVTG